MRSPRAPVVCWNTVKETTTKGLGHCERQFCVLYCACTTADEIRTGDEAKDQADVVTGEYLAGGASYDYLREERLHFRVRGGLHKMG